MMAGTEVKRVLIIGCSDGIGLALVKRLLAEGCQVTGLSRRASPVEHPKYRQCGHEDGTQPDQAVAPVARMGGRGGRPRPGGWPHSREPASPHGVAGGWVALGDGLARSLVMNTISDKLNRSWQLFKRSVLVIRDHPKLLAFPLVTGVLTAGIALFFLAPVALVFVAPHWIEGGRFQELADSLGFLRVSRRTGFNFQIPPMGTLFLAGIYLVDMFVATLGSVAFNSEILEALSGRAVSIRHGIGVACARWKSVLLWSLFAGLVGLVIRALEQRLAFVGRLVAGLIGLAWSVASRVYLCALYLHASEGLLCGHYDASMMDQAWKMKRA